MSLASGESTSNVSGSWSVKRSRMNSPTRGRRLLAQAPRVLDLELRSSLG